MRLGVVASSGGSALAAAYDCLRSAGRSVELVLVSDRECGALDWARRMHCRCERFLYECGESFSRTANDYLRDQAVDLVLLLYTRHVAAPLVGALPVYNIHPSLLPAFRGMHAVERTMAAGSRMIGATLHAVDLELDSGPIIAQIATGVSYDSPLAWAMKVSFLQKVYLILLLVELVRDNGMTMAIDAGTFRVTYARSPRTGINVSPMLTDHDVVSAFASLQAAERCTVSLGCDR